MEGLVGKVWQAGSALLAGRPPWLKVTRHHNLLGGPRGPRVGESSSGPHYVLYNTASIFLLCQHVRKHVEMELFFTGIFLELLFISTH